MRKLLFLIASMLCIATMSAQKIGNEILDNLLETYINEIPATEAGLADNRIDADLEIRYDELANEIVMCFQFDNKDIYKAFDLEVLAGHMTGTMLGSAYKVDNGKTEYLESLVSAFETTGCKIRFQKKYVDEKTKLDEYVITPKVIREINNDFLKEMKKRKR